MPKSLGLDGLELITILQALDLVMTLAKQIGDRESWEDARSLAIKIAIYGAEQNGEQLREEQQEAMEQKQGATIQ